jgi:hypothetical protein
VSPFHRALLAALGDPLPTRPEPTRTAIVQRADRFELLRCRCPECLALDALHPGEGYQLALFPYRPAPLVRLDRKA